MTKATPAPAATPATPLVINTTRVAPTTQICTYQNSYLVKAHTAALDMSQG